ncbi:NUDIX hydrolase [Actinoalloteichus caeruleus]|uniref:NUDIX hydrolase n=1 Tax=Actinoalloteichus cyanogriseus TaxID=2893586 RepID=UPI003BB9A6AC
MASSRDTRTVRAAGAVVWRWRSTGHGAEVAVVHRSRYDDWSLPKGKRNPRETRQATAVREVAEETGMAVALGRSLGSVRYRVLSPDGAGRKVVEYFSAHALGGDFRPGDEVDDLRWLPVHEARAVLTREADRQVLDRFAAAPPDLRTVLLVRHARAGSREEWAGADEFRPLSGRGRKQAEALADLLPVFGPTRVHSAPMTRCLDTVSPVARALGAAVVAEPALTEEAFAREPAAAEDRLLALVGLPETVVVCSQGGAIPSLLSRLAADGGVELQAPRSRKASTWVLSFLPSRPVLVAADYISNPRGW